MLIKWRVDSGCPHDPHPQFCCWAQCAWHKTVSKHFNCSAAQNLPTALTCVMEQIFYWLEVCHEWNTQLLLQTCAVYSSHHRFPFKNDSLHRSSLRLTFSGNTGPRLSRPQTPHCCPLGCSNGRIRPRRIVGSYGNSRGCCVTHIHCIHGTKC